MNKSKELAASHWELSQLYRRNSTDYALIASYWLEIESLEEELNVDK